MFKVSNAPKKHSTAHISPFIFGRAKLLFEIVWSAGLKYGGAECNPYYAFIKGRALLRGPSIKG